MQLLMLCGGKFPIFLENLSVDYHASSFQVYSLISAQRQSFKRESAEGACGDELEDKAAEVVRTLVASITDTPQSLIALYAYLKDQYKNDPEALNKLDDLARSIVTRMPELTRIISDSAKVLETYLGYKASLRQEEATKSLLRQNEILVRHNRLLSYGTVFLAAATLALVVVTVLHL